MFNSHRKQMAALHPEHPAPLFDKFQGVFYQDREYVVLEIGRQASSWRYQLIPGVSYAENQFPHATEEWISEDQLNYRNIDGWWFERDILLYALSRYMVGLSKNAPNPERLAWMETVSLLISEGYPAEVDDLIACHSEWIEFLMTEEAQYYSKPFLALGELDICTSKDNRKARTALSQVRAMMIDMAESKSFVTENQGVMLLKLMEG